MWWCVDGRSPLRPAGAGYQADGWSVDRSFAGVAGVAMRVTAARDEPWRHLAHEGRQERLPVTSPAPPGHRPSQHGRWCPGSTGSCNRAAHLSAYPASPSARLMTTGRGCSWARAGGELALGGTGLESKRFSPCDCMRGSTLCVIATLQMLLSLFI